MYDNNLEKINLPDKISQVDKAILKVWITYLDRVLIYCLLNKGFI